MLTFLKDNIWFILFLIWGFPMSFYRSNFRKIVYETDSWLINIKPLFIKEVKGLFGNIFPNNPAYIKQRNFYRFYLGIYSVLFVLYLIFS
jgi:peroxiredoxin Q/BCP